MRQRRLDELSSDDVVRACEQNYIDYWRCASIGPGVDFSEEGGITSCITSLPQDIFNVVLKCDLGPDTVERRIDEAIDRFRRLRIPVIWHAGLLTRPVNIGEYLSSRGFPKDYDLTAMALDLTSMEHDKRVPEGLVVKVVSTAKESSEWIECLTSSWDSPKEVSAWMRRNACFDVGLEPGSGGPCPRRMYLATLDERPVGASMLFWSDDIAGLQAIGTVESQRRKGVGRAAIMAPLKDAREMGFNFVVVLSTVEGVPLYRKVGFRTFGKLPEHSMHFERA